MSPPDEQPAAKVTRWFDMHAAFLQRTLSRSLGPGPHIDDILQETFILAFKKVERIHETAARSFLYRCAHNKALHLRRSSARRAKWIEPDVKTELDSPAAQPEPETAWAVHHCLRALSSEHREALLLFEFEGLSGSEIAELLDLAEGTVWTRLKFARQKFRLQWDKIMQEGDE